MMLCATLLLVPLSLVNAFGAYLLWEWTAVLSPSYYLFGFMQSVRYNLMFALITITLVFLGRLRNRDAFRMTGTTLAAMLFLLHGSICAALGYDFNPLNQEIYTGLVKSLVFCLLMPMIVTTRLRIHAMLVMLALGLGFHGTIEGAKVLATAGAYRPGGVPTSMMSDNNHLAVALVMALPILFYLFRYSARRVVKVGFMGSFALSVIAVIGTQSRGGFVALAFTGAWLIFTSRRKTLALTMVLSMSLLAALAAPSSWFDRMESIQTAERDDSFLGRVDAWRVSTVIALENPLFGGGFHAVQTQSVWQMHRAAASRIGLLEARDIPQAFKAAHSIYFEVLGDQGFVGLLLFLSFFVVALVNILNVKRMAARHPLELAWGADLASMLGVSILAFAVGGAGVSLAYFETFYVMIFLTDVLRRTMDKEVLSLKGQRSGTSIAGRIADQTTVAKIR